MKSIKIFLFITFLFVIHSCDDSSNPVITINSNFIYPLKVGNQWTYNASTDYLNVSPDSLKNSLINESIDLKVSITKDTLLNSNDVFEIIEENPESSTGYGYYFNSGNGFFKSGYKGGGSVVLPKINNVKRFHYKNISFNSITDLFKQLNGIVNQSNLLNDSIIYFNQPRKVYSYPLSIGKEWIFTSDPEGPAIITKEVAGIQNVQTKVGVFECYKILWKFDFDFDGIPDNNFVYYEYVSAKGLLKTEIISKNITLTTEDNPDSIGHADIKSERILTGVNF